MPSVPEMGTAPRGISDWYGQVSGTSPYLPMLIASSVRPCFVGRARVFHSVGTSIHERSAWNAAPPPPAAPAFCAMNSARLLGRDAHVDVHHEVGLGGAHAERLLHEVERPVRLLGGGDHVSRGLGGDTGLRRRGMRAPGRR